MRRAHDKKERDKGRGSFDIGISSNLKRRKRQTCDLTMRHISKIHLTGRPVIQAFASLKCLNHQTHGSNSHLYASKTAITSPARRALGCPFHLYLHVCLVRSHQTPPHRPRRNSRTVVACCRCPAIVPACCRFCMKFCSAPGPKKDPKRPVRDPSNHI
jgi:hypothetical protein